jgi:hypothetical protein
MANYYYVTIKSEKMTQQVAAEILNRFCGTCRVRSFEFNEGFLKFNTRGLIDITDILVNYGFNDEEIEVKDEFELFYEASTEEDK